MSAWIVTKNHIDALITAGLDYQMPLEWDGNSGTPYSQTSCRLDARSADKVGRMLWQENLNSIHYRYPDTVEGGNHPGPMDFSPTEVEAYTYSHFGARRWSPVAVLKAIDCYEYQSCEHPEWETSEAKRFCDALRLHLIHRLPGYEDAPWGIN